ncbi:MAG: hypothetical protein JNK27_15305 [Chitinophagaceae bacterium]|nr:hypothetical protein [Chitinophagaceae bacterium]
MKAISKLQQLLLKWYAIPLMFVFPTISTAQQVGLWERSEVYERMTNLQDQKARCLPNCSFSGKADDMGMTFEFNYYSNVDRKSHLYRGHVAWVWKNQKGPATLVPGEKVTIRGVINNLSAENSGVTAYAMLGIWRFMKPESGKSGDESAKPNGSAVMVGSFDVPKQPGINRDGTKNPYLRLTFTLSGGNEQSFIERTIVYKWTAFQGQPTIQNPPVTPPPVADTTSPRLYAEKTTYKVGEPIVVRFKNLPGFKADWVGIYGAKAYHANEYIEWKYTNGLKEGTLTFTSPRYGAGEYIFRVYENNGYKLLTQSVAFKVIN